MTTPQKRHRERAAEALLVLSELLDWQAQELEEWYATGQFRICSAVRLDVQQRLTFVAQALADTEAEATAELGKVLVRDLGALTSALAGDNETRLAGPAHLVAMLATGKALAIPLPECSVVGLSGKFLALDNGNALLCTGLADSEGAALRSVNYGRRFRPTLLLEPVENERSRADDH